MRFLSINAERLQERCGVRQEDIQAVVQSGYLPTYVPAESTDANFVRSVQTNLRDSHQASLIADLL